MQRDQLFHVVYEALDAQHCAICHLCVTGTRRFLDGFLYERVNDPWSRSAFIDARGFCAAHAWQLSTIFDCATGIAIVYRHLLDEFRRACVALASEPALAATGRRVLPRSRARRGSLSRAVGAWLQPRRPCPACSDQWEGEDRYAWATAQALPDQDFRTRYTGSLGLCLRHLVAVVRHVGGEASLQWLLQTERGLMERLMRDLEEFWRKHDYRFREEPMSDGERTAWRRVLHKVSGAPGMVWRA
ncbi:MAG: DUF6062 family protein [Armatimonadota bacterium]|nr:DUF6062 family protein [Armatimonadota bacterium]MDR7518267.1 DUF6062 family protein [Armatimonadota bacterium]MDR7548691.1 DUF6062 family protein [Armatimonadota bacterium]